MRRPFRELAASAKADPVRRERIERHKAAMRDILKLAALRSEAGLTQEDVAQRLDVSQSNVSRIEHEDDVYLSTLNNYVTALGGRLEVNVVFSDHTVKLIEK